MPGKSSIYEVHSFSSLVINKPFRRSHCILGMDDKQCDGHSAQVYDAHVSSRIYRLFPRKPDGV